MRSRPTTEQGAAAGKRVGSGAIGEEWVAIRDAAAIAGVKETTIRSWCRSGAIPSRLETGRSQKRRLVPIAVILERAGTKGDDGGLLEVQRPPDDPSHANLESRPGPAPPAEAPRLYRTGQKPPEAARSPRPVGTASVWDRLAELRAEANRKLAELNQDVRSQRQQSPDCPREGAGEEAEGDERSQADADVADVWRRASEAEAESDRLRNRVADLRAEANRKLAQFDDALDESNREVDAARDRADRAEAETALLRERMAEVQAAVQAQYGEGWFDGERAGADTEEEGVSDRQLFEPNRELDAARERADRAEAETALLRERMAHVQAAAERAEAEAASLRQRMAEVRAVTERAEAEAASLRERMAEVRAVANRTVSEGRPGSVRPSRVSALELREEIQSAVQQNTVVQSGQGQDGRRERLDAFFARRDQVARSSLASVLMLRALRERPEDQ